MTLAKLICSIYFHKALCKRTILKKSRNRNWQIALDFCKKKMKVQLDNKQGPRKTRKKN